MAFNQINKQRDANEPRIVAAFIRRKCSVHRVAEGPFDLVVGHKDRKGNRRTHVVEVKAERGRLTPLQILFQQEHKGPLHIVRSEPDVDALVDAWEGESAIVSRGCL